MKELSIEQKAKRYDEALKVLHKYDGANIMFSQSLKEEMFPELKESEDERIRKELLEHCKNQAEVYIQTGNKCPQIQSWIAWLEAQGEHANFRNKIQIGDKVTRNEDGVLVNLSQLKRVAKKDEKQGEQRPTDKVEPKFKIGDIVKHKDNPHLTYILKRFTDDGNYEFHAIGKDGHEGCTCFAVVKYQDDWELVEQKPKKCIYSNDNYIYEERKVLCDGCKEECELRQKPEWSEEDNVKINRIVACLENLNVADNDILLKDVDWLKSLKDRIQPKPKQEWSEEEIEKAAQEWDSKANFNPFYMTMDGDKPTGVKQDITTHKESFKAGINWILKSLRPQNTWKPSDRELGAILAAIGDERQKGSDVAKELLNIYQQLKKLREE